MKRYEGQPLPTHARLAVISNDAIGNFVVASVLLQKLREQYPQATIHYFAGTRVQEFLTACDLFDSWTALHGSTPRFLAELVAGTPPFDFVFNMEQSASARFTAAALSGDIGMVCGPCADAESRGDLPYASDKRGDLWRDSEWIREDLTTAYPFLDSPFIGELFCRLAYLEGPVPKYAVPSEPPPIEVPDILVAPSASLPEKLWPLEHWQQVLQHLKLRGFSVGVLGAPPQVQSRYWKGDSLEDVLIRDGLAKDLRGTLTLPQVAGALANCRAVLTLDNGIMHVGVAGGRPVIGLFRHGIHRLWAPPYANLTVIHADQGADVATIEPRVVIKALGQVLL